MGGCQSFSPCHQVTMWFPVTPQSGDLAVHVDCTLQQIVSSNSICSKIFIHSVLERHCDLLNDTIMPLDLQYKKKNLTCINSCFVCLNIFANLTAVPTCPVAVVIVFPPFRHHIPSQPCARDSIVQLRFLFLSTAFLVLLAYFVHTTYIFVTMNPRHIQILNCPAFLLSVGPHFSVSISSS